MNIGSKSAVAKSDFMVIWSMIIVGIVMWLFSGMNYYQAYTELGLTADGMTLLAALGAFVGSLVLLIVSGFLYSVYDNVDRADWEEKQGEFRKLLFACCFFQFICVLILVNCVPAIGINAPQAYALYTVFPFIITAQIARFLSVPLTIILGSITTASLMMSLRDSPLALSLIFKWYAMLICIHGALAILVQSAVKVSLSQVALLKTNRQLGAAHFQLVETTREAERVHIARELHDTMGHQLMAMNLQWEVLRQLLGSKQEGSEIEICGEVEKGQAITKLLINNVRDVVEQIKQGRHDELEKELRALVLQSNQLQSSLDVMLKIDDSVMLPDDESANAIYRCAQETITNSLRHSNATRLTLAVFKEENSLVLDFYDNGKSAGALVTGQGLMGMKERFDSLQAEFSVIEKNNGFRVVAKIPLRKYSYE